MTEVFDSSVFDGASLLLEEGVSVEERERAQRSRLSPSLGAEDDGLRTRTR